MYSATTRKGFTLIELLVVISIIGVLTAIITANIVSARAIARDTQRRGHLAQVNLALKVYYNVHDTYHIPGTGSGGAGQGWFSYSGGNYTTSVAQGLIDEGLVTDLVHDPLVEDTSLGSADQRPYMRYFSEGGATIGSCVFASLEKPTDADLAKMDAATVSASRLSTLKDSYNMNYADCI